MNGSHAPPRAPCFTAGADTSSCPWLLSATESIFEDIFFFLSFLPPPSFFLVFFFFFFFSAPRWTAPSAVTLAMLGREKMRTVPGCQARLRSPLFTEKLHSAPHIKLPRAEPLKHLCGKTETSQERKAEQEAISTRSLQDLYKDLQRTSPVKTGLNRALGSSRWFHFTVDCTVFGVCAAITQLCMINSSLQWCGEGCIVCLLNCDLR